MDAVVICGGRGTRLESDCEKPLYEIGGVPMIDRIQTTLEASQVESIVAVGSAQTPDTRAHWDGQYIEAPGDGYVADLQYALERVDPPVLTVVADLALLEARTVNRVLEAHRGGSLTVAVRPELKRSLGLSVGQAMEIDGERLVPTGLNVVPDPERSDTTCIDELLVSEQQSIAVNVNRRSDAQIAEVLR